MRRPSREFSRRRDRSGLTLVEVVASTVLLSTLLALLLIAAGAHLRQVRRAQLRLDAVAGLDRLLHETALGQQSPWLRANTAQGLLPGAGAEDFEWTSRRERRRDAEVFLADVVRIEVRQVGNPAGMPLASVELLAARPTHSGDKP